ncbi:hypothetical protein BpHYR1_019311 [Brachionus plicatilis]|uniref:Uncharacterized protein n=1 Tax=Brachionus plicatilis TaxID=10195 RepID=A0A3M7P3E1_BRAPC|nr:hypothetical protein BpHYR1_019311 [Brachionus plicatilis]
MRCENGTRWSSSYLMLESFYKAYEKDAFSRDNPCQVSKNKILSYLKVLHPMYSISLMSQRTDWHIGDVIPSLIVLINGSDESSETGERKKLVKELKKELINRFNLS